MTDKRATIAIAIVVGLLFVSLASSTAWFALKQEDTQDLPNQNENDTETEPVPEPVVVVCEGDERAIFAADQITVIGCEAIEPPANITFENNPLRTILGTTIGFNWTISGDPEFSVDSTCAPSTVEIEFHKHSQQFVTDWSLTALEIGNSSCTIQVSNPAGVTSTELQIEVVDSPPRNLYYQPDTLVLTKGVPLTLEPYWQGGEVTQWSVKPDLPAGLQLRSDGLILGAPSLLMPASTYTITASNEGGDDSTYLTLTVHDWPPTDVAYPYPEQVLTLGEQMVDLLPNSEGGDVVSWEIDPPLPAGLSFSSNSGRISGTPSVLSERASHYIYANNSGGYEVTVVHITVNDHPVFSIDYNTSTIDLIYGVSEIDITPVTTGGTAVDWQIVPSLPIGLFFDSSNGRIWGSGDTITPWTNHTIWANNSGGSFAHILPVRIANMTPANISWEDGGEFVLAANKSVSLSPLNDGPVIDGWEVEPALPSGLILNMSSGEISGVPIGRDGLTISRHAWTEHTVWANNSGGSLESNLTIAIHDLDQDHRDLFKRPIGQVDYGGSGISRILPIGEWSFALAVDSSNRPGSSASHVEKGRMVGFGHEGLTARTGTNAEANLSLNSLDWVCDGYAKTVGLESSFNGWKDTLMAEGYAVITSATPADLVNMDCFVTEFWNGYSDAENTLVTQWLTEGGGLLMGGHAWYWSYSNSDAAHNYPGNKIAKTTGLFVSTSTSSSVLNVNPEPWGDLYRLHGALPLIEQHVVGSQMMSSDNATKAASTINQCVSNLPLDYTGVWDSLYQLSNNTGWIHINSSITYTMDADEVDDLILNIQEQLMLKLPADQLFAHPSHKSFPGEVDSLAPRLNRTRTIDGNYSGLPSQFGYAGARSHGRMSTGLYAVAGEVVNLTFPQSVVNQDVYVLVGAHTDSLWGKSSLLRHPKVARWWYVDNITMQVGNAFGGPIYIAPAAGSTLGNFSVTIDNAVEMPRYVHGVTDVHDWEMVIRYAPAPIAEVESDWFILTVPSWGVRSLDHPNATMDFWDQALQMEHNLSGFTPWPRVERAVFDVQISAGWMHSGYPFMAHHASVNGVLNASNMWQNGDWGMFHELGHNHQWMPSTLPGTTETTCNLYSVKLMTDLVGKDLRAGHSALNNASAKSRVESYFAGGSNLSQWSVWTALETYLQIQEAFGWDPITDALAAYYGMSNPPSGSTAEFNEWVIQISLATGLNMTEFHAAWGFPISSTTQTAVDHLPVWTDDPLRGWVHEYDPETRYELATGVTDTKADLEWHIWDNGTNTTWSVCWGTSDAGTNAGNWESCEGLGTNLTAGMSFHSLSGLLSSTTYYWRLTVDNSNGEWWDEATRSFTTT